MKKTLIRALPAAAAILWAVMIFLWSAEPAAKSSATSGPFADAYIALFHPEYETLSPDGQFRLHEQASFIVRKAAHFTVYAILGFLAALSCRVTLGMERRFGFPALALSALYAAADEAHQFFVPGRACQLRDVLLDSAGALIGVLLAAAAFLLAARIRGKRRANPENGDGFSSAS